MPNKNYQRGTRFERQLVNALKACGATATRSAGSHGKFDVVAHVEGLNANIKVSNLFEWLSIPPKDMWFDWTVRFQQGRLEKLCYAKVIRDGQEWVYLFQCKVKT